MDRAFAHGGVDVAGAADDDEVGQAQFDQSAQTFGTVVRGADNAESVEKVSGEDLTAWEACSSP